jgi:hypothetical protein
MTFATPNYYRTKTYHDSQKNTFQMALSSADMAALKVSVEANFSGVAFNYIGSAFNYKITLEGPAAPFAKAVNFVFPKGRPDIIIQKSAL